MINQDQHIIRKKLWAAATIVCCLFFFACENDPADIAALSSKRIAVEEAKTVESYLSQAGKMKARLTSPVMNRYQTDSPYIEFPKSLHVDFYDDSLGIESQLNALYGRFRENEQKVFLRDSVMVFNVHKDTLRCEELWWDRNRAVFYTDKPVQIHQPDKIIFGNGLEADQGFSWWVIKKVTGEVLVPREGYSMGAPVDTSANRIDSIAPPPPHPLRDRIPVPKDSIKM